MLAIEISSHGAPDVLRPVDRLAPVPAAGEVLLDVVAAGVNRPDLMQRKGQYPPPPGTTDIPGMEVAGRIVALGADVEGSPPRAAGGRVWHVGDEVCALLAGGGYAAQCVVPGVQCLPVPAGLSLVQAAAIPETYFTVWTNLFERGRLASGEWLMMHGGTSGIGTTAIQLAVARGARVIATAGSDEKCRAVMGLGASVAVNYRTEDFVVAVKTATSGRGVDVIIDLVGGPYTARNLECLARDGRLLQIGLQGGATAEVSLRTIMTKRLTLTGSTLRFRSPAEKGAIAAAVEREIWPLLASGVVKPIIAKTLPLTEAAEAHRLLEEGLIVGKIVLVVS